VGEAYYSAKNIGVNTSVSDCSAECKVSGTGSVGGILGYTRGDVSISDSYVLGDVIGTSYYIGGLVGYDYFGDVSINDSYVVSKVSGTDLVGGLVGSINGDTNISNSCVSGEVSGTGHNVGGLVGGSNYVSISGSHVSGDVSGTEDVGGLAGNAGGGNISDSYISGKVSGTQDVGGLVAVAVSTSISGSYVSGDVSGTSYVGGLVGRGYGNSISGSYVSGEVTGTSYIGGLVGQAHSGTNISESYVSGEVSGNGYVGGLVGYGNNSVSISNSYISGEVSGTGNYVGGLMGYAYNAGTSISKSYISGEVSGNQWVGGLMGFVNNGAASISDSYALVAGITSNAAVGRVSGRSSYVTLSDNYAWKGTVVTLNGTEVNRTSASGNSNAAHDKIDGKDINTWDAVNTNGSGYPTFDFDDVWTFDYEYGEGGYNVTELTNLPILKVFNNLDFPNAVQTPYLPYMSGAEILTPSGAGYEDFSGFRILRGQWYSETTSKVTYLVRVNEESDPDYIKSVLGNFTLTGASSNGFEIPGKDGTNLYHLLMTVDSLTLTDVSVGGEIDVGGVKYCEISFNIKNTLKSGVADFTLSYTENSRILATGVQVALIPGDVDKDEKVGSSDHTLIYNYMKSISQSPPRLAAGGYAFELADINKDGKISTSDHTLVYNMYQNNIPTN
jgi:hypothetical protein